uniref:Histone acetyltransferase n=1 Tax=Meloidogyne incognita TaxID=6306 RepID=A0A914LKF3_MELIC
MPSLRSSIRVTRSRRRSDMRTTKSVLVQLNSLSLEKKKIIKKEMLHNNKKLFRGETVSPSALPTSNRKLRISLSSLSNSSGSPELDLNQIVLRKKIIQSSSTDTTLNNSTSFKQDNQQSFEQKQILIQNPSQWQTPESKNLIKFQKTPGKTKRRNGCARSSQSSEIFSALQKRVLTEMGIKPEGQSKRNTLNQWLQFGQFVRFKPLYEGSYAEPLNSASIIYVCEFCLTHFLSLHLFKTHVKFCPCCFPPGNEIYRDLDEGICIWEVEGCFEMTYCRNLCLMAKLFMSSKTLYHEVDTFTFYILTEISSRGCVTVGYFSKEKNPSKNNNLSCLLTLPHAQGKGYGKLLIDLSYQFSKLEHKIGSPEHPLSDMGLLAYRSYWRSVLFSVLRQRNNSQTIAIKDLSIETAIHSSDIISTLIVNDMLVSRHDCFYIDTEKALNASPDSLRRRSIRADLLKWLPPFDPIPHSKMNSYASN